MAQLNDLLALERDLIAAERLKIRGSFEAFCRYALAPFDLVPAPHHLLLIAKLQAVADRKISRLMVLMPPGSAKSTYASKLFPAWLFSTAPRLSIIGASHTAYLAEDFSREIQNFARDGADMLGYELANDSADLWRTSNGGRYKAAGVGGPITGSRADFAIIDDAVKSREDADSEAYRNRTWRWFISDLRSRLKPGAAIVAIQTRWHADDLAGRLLEAQRGLWDVLCLPAIAGDDDPLGRPPGGVLWNDDPAYPYGADLLATRAEFELSGAMRDWSALYQQSPTMAEGALFKIAAIETLDAAPAGGIVVRAWDLAATKKLGTRDPDWTVGLKLSRDPAGRFVVQDVVRLRGGPAEVEAAILNTAAQDGRGVRISIPQDPGQAGKAQIAWLTSKLAGHTVESSPETGDKSTRAAPVASQVNVGNLSVVRAWWNAALLDEMAAFPSGAHDDQVDALSRAFSVIGLRRPPMRISAEALALTAVRSEVTTRRAA